MNEIDFDRRKLLKQLAPDDAIAFYLESIPDDRRKLVFALWEMLTDLTDGVMRRAYSYRRDRVLTLIEVVTDDLPELLHLAPEERMPLEMKEMFRAWISGFQHMLPRQRVESNDRKKQMEVEILLGAWLKAGWWVAKGVQWLEISESPLEGSRI